MSPIQLERKPSHTCLLERITERSLITCSRKDVGEWFENSDSWLSAWVEFLLGSIYVTSYQDPHTRNCLFLSFLCGREQGGVNVEHGPRRWSEIDWTPVWLAVYSESIQESLIQISPFRFPSCQTKWRWPLTPVGWSVHFLTASFLSLLC